MLLKIYSDNPNQRDIRRVADVLRAGEVVVLPTDTLYAFACSMEYKRAVEAIATLKGFSLKKARYSMLCASLSQLSDYVRPMDKEVFALLKSTLPGPYTYVMDANNRVPRNYQNANKTIGMRVPDNSIVGSVIEELGCPLVATSVRRLDDSQEIEYISDPELIHEAFSSHVSLVVDGGIGGVEPSTVVDVSSGDICLLRQGKGAWGQ